jgi:hypothetical protein
VAITTVLGGRALLKKTARAMTSISPAPTTIVCHRERFGWDDDGEESFMVLPSNGAGTLP